MIEMMDVAARTNMTTVNETAVAEPDAPVVPAEPEKKPDEKEDIDDIEKRARKPPADGPCKGCGQNMPLNRLMLCYKCWVHKNISDWSKGNGGDFIPSIDPHPFWCKCTLPDHGGKRTGDN